MGQECCNGAGDHVGLSVHADHVGSITDLALLRARDVRSTHHRFGRSFPIGSVNLPQIVPHCDIARVVSLVARGPSLTGYLAGGLVHVGLSVYADHVGSIA